MHKTHNKMRFCDRYLCFHTIQVGKIRKAIENPRKKQYNNDST